VVINDYEKAKSLFADTSVDVFKKGNFRFSWQKIFLHIVHSLIEAWTRFYANVFCGRPITSFLPLTVSKIFALKSYQFQTHFNLITDCVSDSGECLSSYMQHKLGLCNNVNRREGCLLIST